jgi:hypothetical protein
VCTPTAMYKFFPDDRLLSTGKALCLKPMVGTFIWSYGSKQHKGKGLELRSVRAAMETEQQVQAIHASLAGEKDDCCSQPVGSIDEEDQKLGEVFVIVAGHYAPPVLENATSRSPQWPTLCELPIDLAFGKPILHRFPSPPPGPPLCSGR